jgi:uncharacterized membrane protein
MPKRFYLYAVRSLRYVLLSGVLASLRFSFAKNRVNECYRDFATVIRECYALCGLSSFANAQDSTRISTLISAASTGTYQIKGMRSTR